MITQRQIDEWHIEAQEFIAEIQSEFMRAFNVGRENPQLPPQAQQAQPPLPQEAQPQLPPGMIPPA